MMDNLRYDQGSYDLDGLLRISEEAMADFLFMIQEEEQELYYLDRMENQKYDSSFNGFMRRTQDYLEQDEMRGVFVLFARGAEGEVIELFDGNNTRSTQIDTGEIELDEATFYGMMIQAEEGEYSFREVLFRRESYQGDAHAIGVSEIGELSERLLEFIKEFE